MSKDFYDAADLEKSNFFISPNQFTFHKDDDFLGNGAFGSVYRCYHGHHGQVAVKIFDLRGSRSYINDVVTDLREEMEIMLLLQKSPQVVSVHGFTAVRHCVLGLVMEYLPRGSLFDLARSKKGKREVTAPWPLMLRIMHETAAGLAFLHQVRFDERITHNDLKPENILLDVDFHAKLCDFGGSNLAAHTSKRGASAKQRPDSDVYTANYAAPEYLAGKATERTRAMDVYSYGMIVYFVLAKTTPFCKLDSAVMINQVTTGVRPPLNFQAICETAAENDDRTIISVLSQTMKDCWVSVPKERPQISVVENSLMAKLEEVGVDIVISAVKELSDYMPLDTESDPSSRIGLNDKCTKKFVPRLKPPFDEEERQPLLSPQLEQSPWGVIKATISQTHGFTQNTFKPDAYKELAEARLEKERNPKPMFKATCSSSGQVAKQPIAVGEAIEIDISHTATELRKRDKIYIRTKLKLAECVVKNTSTRDEEK